MNLSGWQRVGIVISLLWVLTVGGICALEIFKDPPFGEFLFIEHVPDGSSAPIVKIDPSSGKKLSFVPMQPMLNIKALIFSIVGPIAFGWLFVYLPLWTFRLVRSRFRTR